MKIHKLLVIAVMSLASLSVGAQQDNTPQKGDFTLAATVGYNNYASVTALPGNLTMYEGAALSTNWADKKLMVGFEAGWFFQDLWKLNVGGGLNFSHNPGYGELPGTIDGTTESLEGEIPSYRAVADAQTFSYNLSAGVDRYFDVKSVKNLMWYAGARIGVAFAQHAMKYDEELSMGKSVGETWNLRGVLTVGFDYFVLPALYVGAQIDPFSYTYNMTAYKPQEGLSTLDADSHNFSLLAAPTLKVGFRF